MLSYKTSVQSCQVFIPFNKRLRKAISLRSLLLFTIIISALLITEISADILPRERQEWESNEVKRLIRKHNDECLQSNNQMIKYLEAKHWQIIADFC